MRRAHHNGLVQRATAAQAALEEHRRAQQARLAEARQAEEHHKSLLSRLDPANACAPRPLRNRRCCEKVLCLFRRRIDLLSGSGGSRRVPNCCCRCKYVLGSKKCHLHCRYLYLCLLLLSL